MLGCWVLGCWVLGCWVLGCWVLGCWVLGCWVLGYWGLGYWGLGCWGTGTLFGLSQLAMIWPRIPSYLIPQSPSIPVSQYPSTPVTSTPAPIFLRPIHLPLGQSPPTTHTTVSTASLLLREGKFWDPFSCF